MNLNTLASLLFTSTFGNSIVRYSYFTGHKNIKKDRFHLIATILQLMILKPDIPSVLFYLCCLILKDYPRCFKMFLETRLKHIAKQSTSYAVMLL